MATALQGKDIVCVASANWDGLWVNSQHIMHRLAKANKVLYIESLGLRAPTASKADFGKVTKRIQNFFGGLKRPDPGVDLHLLSPLILPFHGSKVARNLNAGLLARSVRGAMNKLGMQNPLLWIFLPTGASLIGKLGESAVIYYCVDDYAANPGVNADTVRALEESILQQADIVFATSETLFTDKRRRHPRCFYTPNCADVESYAQIGALPSQRPKELQNLGGAILGFVGNISSYKVDFKLLQYLASRHPEWNIALIGPVGEGDPSTDVSELRLKPNIHLLGRKTLDELPHYVAHFTVGLIPYCINETTASSFPMKFYEYMAAGIPIVSTDLPALAKYRDKPVLVKFGHSPESFVQAVEYYVQMNLGAETRMIRLEEARKYSWESRIASIGEIIRHNMGHRGAPEAGA